jgi:L-aspartate oxidase
MESLDQGDRPVVIGAGIAGLMTALYLAPEPVVVLARTPLGSGIASAFAQGGIAAALGADDTPALHAADTLAAGDALCDRALVERVAAAAAAAIAALERHGVAFDRGPDGGFALGLEAAHRRRRIVHAGGDRSGGEVMRALVEAVRRTPSITVLTGLEARRLLVVEGRVLGVLATGPAGALMLPASRVVIATGGLGALYRHTTNPLGALGQGMALAARAGALLADMEFVQFHPTALDVGLDPMPLVSEAVRGEGAVLVDETGARFTDELEPRDQVARAVWQHQGDGHRVFLDARDALGARFAARFPAIAARCLAAGIDPARAPIPVRPAAHYHMGGIAVDAEGRSTVAGLWACGEAAATGLHGANRLASNSLLEAAVCARWVAQSVAGTAPRRLKLPPAPALPPPAEAGAVRPIISAGLGVVRDRAGLTAAIAALRPLAFGGGPAADPAAVGLVVATAALARAESRGAHWRSDFPYRSRTPRRSTLRLSEVETLAARALMDAPATVGG